MSSTDESVSPADRPATGPVPEPDRPPLGSAMPRWLPRAMVMALALVAAFQLGTWAFHQLTSLLINILIAFFLALAVEPAVSWMAARGMRRGLATAAVFLGLLVASAGFVTLLGSMLAGQIVDMVEDFPKYLDSVISWINQTFHTDLSRLEVQDSLVHSDWLRRYVQNSATVQRRDRRRRAVLINHMIRVTVRRQLQPNLRVDRLRGLPVDHDRLTLDTQERVRATGVTMLLTPHR